MTAPTIIQHRMLRFCCWEAAISDVAVGFRTAAACEGALLAVLNENQSTSGVKQAAKTLDGQKVELA